MPGTIEQIILSGLQNIFDQFGWLGVFALMVFENATGITPSEIILAFAGWMLIERHDIPSTFIPLAGLFTGLASAIGASITYWVARIGGRAVIEKLARFFRVDLRYVEFAEEQVRKKGVGIVLVGRVIPGLRTLVSIPAGLARMPFPTFFVATFAGAYIWCTALIGAGYILGHEWMLIGVYIKTHMPLVVSILFLVLGGYLLYTYRAVIPWGRWFNRVANGRESSSVDLIE